MQCISITLPAVCDPCAALSESMAVFGSLAASREAWARVLGCQGWRPLHTYLLPAAMTPGEFPHEALAREATPEEGDPHPQRARVGVDDDGELYFVTPGGVTVWARPGDEPGDAELLVSFGRDSAFAATQVLAALAGRGVPGAASLLAQAAGELAARESTTCS